MMLPVKAIWHLFKLCAIGFALAVTGSRGFGVFPFEEPFSSFPPLEEQKHDYVLRAAKLLNELAAQPAPGPPPFESSPPGPEDVQPFPQQRPSVVSPTQSFTPPPTESFSPRPDVSANVTHLKKQDSSAPTASDFFARPLPLPEVPSHDLATPPVAAPLHDHVLESPAVAPHNLTPLLPVFAPLTSPQAYTPLHASAPASTSVPKHIPSLPPPAILPSSSVPQAPLSPSHVIPSSPPVPPPSATPSSPAVTQKISTAPPPFWPEHTPLSVVTMPSHTSPEKPPAVSPRGLAPLAPPIAPASSFHTPTPMHTVGPRESAPYQATGPPPDLGDSAPPLLSRTSAPTPRAMPSHGFVSPPVLVPPSPFVTSTPRVPSHSSAPAPQTMPRNYSVPPHPSAVPPVTVPPHVVVPPLAVKPHFSAPPPFSLPYISALPPDSTVSGHFSTPPPAAAAVHVSGLPPQPIQKDVSVPPHPSAIPPTTFPFHVLVPLPAIKPHFSAPPPSSMPCISAPPSNSTVSGHFSTPPRPAAAAVHVSGPPPHSVPEEVSVPPHPSAVPPTYAPSHIRVPPPAAQPHFSAPPPVSMPYISAPPPDSTVSGHFSTPPAAAVHVSGPAPQAMPRDVSVPPHPSTPSHVLVPPPPPSKKPHVSTAPPLSTPYISAPPPDSTVSGHISIPPPPSASVQVSSPPPDELPANVSLPPAAEAPLRNSPPHFAKPRFLAPPPLWMHNVSAPLSNPPSSVNGSYPPSAPVSPHASGPSIAAEPPLISSPPSLHPVVSGSLPPVSYTRKKPKHHSSQVSSNSSVQAVAPTARPPLINPVVSGETPSIPPERHFAQVSSPTPSFDTGRGSTPVAIAPSPPRHAPSPINHHPPRKGFPPSIAPVIHRSKGLFNIAPAPTISPIESPTGGMAHSPSSSPLPTINKARHRRDTNHSAPEASYAIPSPAPKQQDKVENPYPSLAPAPESKEIHHLPGPSAAMVPSDSPSSEDYISPVPMSALTIPSGHSMTPFLPPAISPSGSSTRKRNRQLAPPILALPPPPPNQDCLSLTCVEPFTNTIPGSPCGCVKPMKVELRIGVALYTFFPLVPELAQEVAMGTFMKQSQVRIMGANAASEQPEKTLILIDLVPLGDKFDNITAFLIYERFWNKRVAINKSLFGDYEVLYVEYPGLPPSPPAAPSDIAIINGGPYPGQDSGGRIHPLGVDVTKQGHKRRFTGSLIAIIVSSAVGAVLLCLALGSILLFRRRRQVDQSAQAPDMYAASVARSTGPPGQSAGSGPSSSLSFGSSAAAYTGSAKTLSAVDVEKATDNFDPARIIGEGGFGRVYSGVLEDGTQVAVKVLKREDQQGGREFLAEVEMLSRLHHRNLVKLIGICVDERARSLIYELVSNGSVESHLHGIDRETSPLDWAARMKIALGAARGLAYLHEDSSPRVIHRDFKASNILLEPDFTPKVSDFGLARTAMDEENMHISTRVMGTFGYVAPEYAMTGHLLVKSDVYSYGVVLLELLTGRKPVDMSQPPGQENLVAWMRPFLTSKEGLRSILDPYLGQDVLSFDSVAKVAAIASMCVQPEVSHRPFMGEVVQALKLVCNETNGEVDGSPRSCCSHENLCDGTRNHPLESYFSGGNGEDVEKGLSSCDHFDVAGSGGKGSGTFYRNSSSGPLRGRRGWRFWQRGRRTTSREAVNGEDGMYRFWSGSH